MFVENVGENVDGLHEDDDSPQEGSIMKTVKETMLKAGFNGK